jgi:predicted transcriptional regulator
MRKSKEEYWWNRLELLKSIQRDGGNTAFSRITKPYYSWGGQIKTLIEEFEKREIVEFVKDATILKSYVTEKGERLIKVLSELKEVWGER